MAESVPERVLLVHGLWMHPVAMTLMQRWIEQSGYAVESWSYATIRATLAENAERLSEYCRAQAGSRLHLVGHSMGGLVVLSAAAVEPIPCLGRIVVAGTPFTGSVSARQLERLPGGRALLGECISEWLRNPRHDVASNLDVGVIAGNGGLGLGRLIAPDLPLPNDGVVTVSETRIPGMKDHIVLNVSHTEMLASAEVANQICEFLRSGRFNRSDGAESEGNHGT